VSFLFFEGCEIIMASIELYLEILKDELIAERTQKQIAFG
jgi:hypothetical protein